MRSPVLVGRSAELATVRRLVDAAAAGSGGALLVTGEAGIGKSRLLEEAVRRASDAGLLVLSGRAVQGGGTHRAVAEAVIGTLDRPALRESEELRPYRAVLGRLLPGWAGDAPGPPDVDPAVLLGEGLLRLLAQVGPCLVRLEDLQWADEDTLALVEHLAGAVAATRVLLAVSARDDPPARAAARLAQAPGMTTLRPARLSHAEIAQLAGASRGGRPVPEDEVRQLSARSDGLPFLVEELLAGTDDAVPPTLAGLVGARLATLSEDDRAVVVAAAVTGSEPDWRLLAPTVDRPEEAVLGALRAAVDAGLLAADGARMRWRHALTREAVLGTVLPPDRAVLARRAAEVLGRRAGPDDEPRAAELFLEAGEPDRAADLLLGLAGRAAARGALRSADQLLAGAAATGARTSEVTIERVAVLGMIGRVAEALDLGEAALGALSGDAHAEICLRLARAAVVGARWSAAEGYVERAGRPDDPRSLVLLADAAFGAGRATEAGALAAAAVDRAERATAPAALCEALGILTRTELRNDLAAAATAWRRAAQVAAEHGLTPWRVEAMAGLGIVEAALADDPTAALLRARELALDAGMLAQLVSIDTVLCDHVLTVDGPQAAEPIARRAVEAVTPLRLPSLRAVVEILLAGCVGWTGDSVGMSGLLDATVRRRHGDAEVAALASLMRAVGAVLDHDLGRASAVADTATAYLLRHDAAPPLTTFGLWALLRTAVGEGGAEARARIRAHPAYQRPANRGALSYADAVAAGRAGRADEASALFEAGDATLAGLPWWRRVLRLVVLEAAVVDGWGDPVPHLRADLAAHEKAEDARQARTCRDLLRRAGQPTRRGRGRAAVPPALRALGVTSREVDVLELVTQGLTNTQVAERLFLSPRTVDTHVASLLGKTGAATRGELGAWVG